MNSNNIFPFNPEILFGFLTNMEVKSITLNINQTWHTVKSQLWMLSDSESTFASIWVKQISDIFIVDLQHAEFDLENKTKCVFYYSATAVLIGCYDKISDC